MSGTYANLFGLLLMTGDHFIAVRFSLKHRIWMRKRVIFSLISLAWVLAVILGFLELAIILSKDTMVRDYAQENFSIIIEGFCLMEVAYRSTSPDGRYQVPVGQEVDYLVQSLTYIIIISCVLVSMLCVYTYIACVVIRVSRQRGARQRQTLVEEKEIHKQMTKRQTKGICTTLLLLVSFCLLWAPVQVVKLLEINRSSALTSTDVQLLNSVLAVVASCTGLVDVIVYLLRTAKVKKCFRRKADGKGSKQLISKVTLTTHL